MSRRRITRRQVLAVAAPVLAVLQQLVRRLLIVAGISLLAFTPSNHAKNPQPYPTLRDANRARL